MRLVDRIRRCRYVLQPWRYETEYARAWCEVDFPVYGLADDAERTQRMGPKGRTGRMPDGVLRWLPPMFWTRMTHLGVIESTSSWRVTVDSGVDQHVSPVGYLKQRLQHHPPRTKEPRRAAARMELESRSVGVGALRVRFDGVASGSLWLGAGRVGDVVVEVLTEDVPSDHLELFEITDPAPYLSRNST